MNIFISEAICHFSSYSDCKKEKSVVIFMHEQNIICSQTQLDNIAHEQTIIRSQFFAGHMVDFQPIKRNLKAFDSWRLCGRNFVQELKEILTPV